MSWIQRQEEPGDPLSIPTLPVGAAVAWEGVEGCKQDTR